METPTDSAPANEYRGTDEYRELFREVLTLLAHYESFCRECGIMNAYTQNRAQDALRKAESVVPGYIWRSR